MPILRASLAGLAYGKWRSYWQSHSYYASKVSTLIMPNVCFRASVYKFGLFEPWIECNHYVKLPASQSELMSNEKFVILFSWLASKR